MVLRGWEGVDKIELQRWGDFMNMTPVKSSQISAVGHDGGTLRIRFNNGSEYDYSGVTQDDYDKLMSAESIGAHFGKSIRGAYEYSKVEKKEEK